MLKVKKEIIYRVRYEGHCAEDSYHKDYKTRKEAEQNYKEDVENGRFEEEIALEKIEILERVTEDDILNSQN